VIWKNVALKTWQTIVETCSSNMFQNLCRFLIFLHMFRLSSD
jgi:hypothetical protein